MENRFLRKICKSRIEELVRNVHGFLVWASGIADFHEASLAAASYEREYHGAQANLAGPAECAEPFAGGRRKKDQQWDPVQLCPNKGVGFNRSARPHLQIKHSVCELQSLQCKQSCGYSH